jgi:hypothetical protein
MLVSSKKYRIIIINKNFRVSEIFKSLIRMDNFSHKTLTGYLQSTDTLEAVKTHKKHKNYDQTENSSASNKRAKSDMNNKEIKESEKFNIMITQIKPLEKISDSPAMKNFARLFAQLTDDEKNEITRICAMKNQSNR